MHRSLSAQCRELQRKIKCDHGVLVGIKEETETLLKKKKSILEQIDTLQSYAAKLEGLLKRKCKASMLKLSNSINKPTEIFRRYKNQKKLSLKTVFFSTQEIIDLASKSYNNRSNFYSITMEGWLKYYDLFVSGPLMIGFIDLMAFFCDHIVPGVLVSSASIE